MAAFCWYFRNPLPEQAPSFLALVRALADEHGAQLWVAEAAGGPVLRADFSGEEAGRAFWSDLYSQCLDQNLGMELAAEAAAAEWRRLEDANAADAAPGGAVVIEPRAGTAAAPGRGGLDIIRPAIPEATLYDILRGDDPEMEVNLDATIRWIEAAGLPMLNLLSYLELPLYLDYARTHAEERDQNLFLHMLHTWTCYRYCGAHAARISAALAEAFTAPRYLRCNTTAFRSPAPALCLQFEPWTQPLRGRGEGTAGGAPEQWAKEVYLTHLEPPTPADDRELTLMIVSHDARGDFGFVPLEIPLSLPGVGQSIDAFFAPGEEDAELEDNTRDLHRLATVAATWCLYACARNPARYLESAQL